MPANDPEKTRTAARTYRDLAKLAGVSVAAVSMALRNRPGVSPETRERIIQLAKKHDYRVNPLVSALMVETRQRRRQGVRAIMGLLVHERMDSKELYKAHYGVSEYLRGAMDAAQENGYVLEQFIWKELHGDIRSFQRALYTRRMVGLLIHLDAPAPSWFTPDWTSYATASIGNVIHLPDLDGATHDHIAGMQLALRQVHQTGHRRIGIVLRRSDQKLQEYRYLSAYCGARHYLEDFVELPPFYHDDAEPRGLEKWIKSQRPTAIITADHLLMESIRSLGFRIPEDISFVHLDVDKRWTHLAGVDQNSYDVGSAAVELVIGRLNRNQYGVPKVPHITMIEGRWIDGPSLRPPSPRSRRAISKGTGG